MKPKVIIGFILIFIIAYLLRTLFLSQNALTFGYDQARDALTALQIVSGDLKILGPPASTPGLHHGVLYDYVLAPAYWIGNGSPIVAAYWIAFLNSLTVFIAGYLTFLMTKKLGAALLASFLFAISFEATQYAAWLSNPTLGVWTVPLVYLGLWAWVKERKSWGPVVCGLGLGLSVQAEVFLLYHAAPILIWLLVAKPAKKQLLWFVASFALAVSTMIVSELKFGFRSLGGVLHLLTTQDAIVASRGLGDFVVLFLNQLGKVFAFSSYPGNVGYGGVFILVLIAVSLLSRTRSSRRSSVQEGISWQAFLATWLLSHLTVVTVGGTSTPFLLVGIGPAVSVLLGITIYKWLTSGKKVLAYIVLAIVVLGNISMILKENPKGQTIFSIQKDMLLSKQLAAIDYTYQEAEGKPFSINTLTSPLWINIVWTYLYNWYGQPKYGYVPEYHGQDQVGQLAALPETRDDTKLYFLIIEPMAGIPAEYLPNTIAEEEGKSKFVKEVNFGELVVQKRERMP